MRTLRAVALTALVLACALTAGAREKAQGYCSLASAFTRVVSCTVTVYNTGTTNLATIYADNIGTPKANPFTADATTGLWSFYADNSRYDVRLSGGTPTISPAYTLSDFLLLDTATASQATTFGGDITPVTDNTNNVGTAALTWNNGRFTNLTIDTALTSGGTLAVTGASTLTGAVTTGSTLATGGNLSVTGNGTFTGNVSGVNATFTGTGNVTGAFTGSSTGQFATSLTVTGAGAFLSIGANPAVGGVIRLPNNQTIIGRNAANSGDINLLQLDSSDQLRISGSGSLTRVEGALAVGTLSASAATAGTVRIPNTGSIQALNNAGSANIRIARVDTSDDLLLGEDGDVVIGSPGNTVGIFNALRVTGPLYDDTISAFTNGDTTPPVNGSWIFVTANTAPTTITMFDSGTSGQIIIIKCGDTNTSITDGGNLKLAGAFTCSADDTIVFLFDGTDWLEVSRSVN